MEAAPFFSLLSGALHNLTQLQSLSVQFAKRKLDDFTYMYMNMYMYMCTYIRMCTYIYIYTHVHANEYMCACMHLCMYACVNVCMYIYIYRYAYTYIHIYICMQARTCVYARASWQQLQVVCRSSVPQELQRAVYEASWCRKLFAGRGN